MKSLLTNILAAPIILLLGVLWLAGIVLAKGFWMTLFACWPPVAWYLVVERVMQTWGIV